MIIQNDVYKILVQVILEKGHCNVLLAQMMRDKNLTLSEKETIEKIVLGTLKKSNLFRLYIKSNMKCFEISNYYSFSHNYFIMNSFIWNLFFRNY